MKRNSSGHTSRVAPRFLLLRSCSVVFGPPWWWITKWWTDWADVCWPVALGGWGTDSVHELPPRGSEVGLLGDSREEVEAAQSALRERGYIVPNNGCFVIDSALCGNESPAHEGGCKTCDDRLVERGTSSVQLWVPSPLLHWEIERIESLLLLADGQKRTTTGRALDIACGSGRDAVFLALRGCMYEPLYCHYPYGSPSDLPHARTGEVVGVDHLEGQIEKLLAFAEQKNVADRVKGVRTDVEKNNGSELVTDYPESFDLVSVSRFLHRFAPIIISFRLVFILLLLNRPLIPDVLAKLTKPGGLVAYHTFMVGAEKFGRPRSHKHLLQAGELGQSFSGIGWEILVDLTISISDGRPCSVFIARKGCPRM